jgi:hypothetical protein
MEFTMNIRWNDLITEISKLKFKYDTQNKTIYTNLKSKNSYLYKLLSKITPSLITIWKKKYNIELNFDLIIKDANFCKIMKCSDLEYTILKDVEPIDWAYFQYLFNHKLNVIKNGIDLIEFLGLSDDRNINPNVFLSHDMSKFGKYEWSQYANYFYNTDGTPKDENSLVETPEVKKAFKHHQMNNKHHSEFHTKHTTDRMMTLIDIIEMFADWKTMGGYYKSKTYEWYKEAYQKLQFNEFTRKIVEFLMVKCESYFKDKKYIKCNFE